jgi:hypothetical protein
MLMGAHDGGIDHLHAALGGAGCVERLQHRIPQALALAVSVIEAWFLGFIGIVVLTSLYIWMAEYPST